MKKTILLAMALMASTAFWACDDSGDDTANPDEQTADNSQQTGNQGGSQTTKPSDNTTTKPSDGSTTKPSDNSGSTTQPSDNSGSSSSNPSNSQTGTVTAWANGFITTYNKVGDYPWPIQTVEKGYYRCAPSTDNLKNFILGSCYELDYKGKKIKVIADDMCPDGPAATWFDLELDGFKALTGLTTGKPNVKWREIPYYTDKNISAKVKDGSSQWLIGLYILGGRYGVKKVEVSNDGKTYYAMEAEPHNAFWKLEHPGNYSQGYKTPLNIRITDKHNHQIVCKLSEITPNKTFDLGKNFEY